MIHLWSQGSVSGALRPPCPFLWGLSGHSEDGKSSGRDGRRAWHFLLWGWWSRKVGRSLQSLQYRVEAGGDLAQQEGEDRGRPGMVSWHLWEISKG